MSAYLRKLQIFGPLAESDKDALERLAVGARIILARADLLRQGELPKSAFLFLEGFACRYREGRDGQRQITALFLPGDFCDLNIPNLTWADGSIGAISQCKVAEIVPNVLREFQQRPALARAMRMGMIADVANTREWLYNVGRRKASERLAHLLCEIHDRLNAVGLVENGCFFFPLTQGDLANAIGLSTVHLNRTLLKLKDNGFIRIRQKNIKITDVSGLKNFVGFDSSYLYLNNIASYTDA